MCVAGGSSVSQSLGCTDRTIGTSGVALSTTAICELAMDIRWRWNNVHDVCLLLAYPDLGEILCVALCEGYPIV